MESAIAIDKDFGFNRGYTNDGGYDDSRKAMSSCQPCISSSVDIPDQLITDTKIESDLLSWLDSGDLNGLLQQRQQQHLDKQQSWMQLPLPVGGKQVWHQRQEHFFQPRHSSSSCCRLRHIMAMAQLADMIQPGGHNPAPMEARAGQRDSSISIYGQHKPDICFLQGMSTPLYSQSSYQHKSWWLAANRAEMQARRCKCPNVPESSFTSSCYAAPGEKQTQAQAEPAPTNSAAASRRGFAAVSARSRRYALQRGPRTTSTRLPDITLTTDTSEMQITSGTYSSGFRLEQQPPTSGVTGHTGSLHLGTSCMHEDQSSLCFEAEVKPCGMHNCMEPLLLGTASDITNGSYSEIAESDALAATAGRIGSSCVIKSSAAHAMAPQWQEEHQQEPDMAGMDNCQQVHGPRFSWPPRTAAADSWCSAPLSTWQRDHQRCQLLTQRDLTWPHPRWTPAAAAAAHLGPPQKQLQTASAATYGQQQLLQPEQLTEANKYRKQLHRRMRSLQRQNLIQKIAMKVKQTPYVNSRVAAAALALLKNGCLE